MFQIIGKIFQINKCKFNKAAKRILVLHRITWFTGQISKIHLAVFSPKTKIPVMEAITAANSTVKHSMKPSFMVYW